MRSGKKRVSKSSVKPNSGLFQDDLDFPDETLENAKDAIIRGENISQSITAITTRCNELAAGSRKQQREQILIVYAIALTLKDNPEAYATFCRNSYWKKKGRKSNPDPRNADKALDLLIDIVVSPQEKDDQKQTSLFRRALGRHFLANKSAQEIKQLLEEYGGLRGLVNHNKALSQTTAPALKSCNENDDEFFETTVSDDTEEEISFEGMEVSNVDDEGGTEFSLTETEDELDFSEKEPPALIYEKLEKDDLEILGSSLKQAWLVLRITGQPRDFSDLSVKLEKITLEDPTGPNIKS